MNPFKLLDPSYLFDITPGQGFLYFWPLVIFFILFFGASWYADKQIHAHRHYKVAREFLGGISMRMREFALMGLILTFLRWQNVPILGMRFWMILFFLLGAVYGVWVWRRYENGFRKALRSKKSKEVVDLYRPQAKKKKRGKKR